MKLVKKDNIKILPSLICLDQCNLLTDTEKMLEAGFDTLHIDLIDGSFSPSMPLGFHAVRQLREATQAKFDVHMMVENREFFLDAMLSIGAESVCFQMESIRHVDRWLGRIKESGARAGVALMPATPVSQLEAILDSCDYVMLMLINPGFADTKSEKQIPYALQKIRRLKAMIDERGISTKIAVDGRITLDSIESFCKEGVELFVAGTSCLTGNIGLEESVRRLNELLEKCD